MRNFVFSTIAFLMIVQVGYCQKDTIIYYKSNNKPATKDEAIKYIDIHQRKKDCFDIRTFEKVENKWVELVDKEIAYISIDSSMKILTENDMLITKRILRKYSRFNNNFQVREFYENGKLSREGVSKSLLPLHFEGEVKTYYESGQPKSIEVYLDNQMISNQNWLENGTPYVNNIFTTVDVAPEYPGGITRFRQYIARSLQYPEKAQEGGIQGKVIVQFVIKENGDIDGVRVVHSINPELDNEALRVVKSLSKKWIAGILDGKNVNVLMRFPVTFSLSSSY